MSFKTLQSCSIYFIQMKLLLFIHDFHFLSFHECELLIFQYIEIRFSFANYNTHYLKLIFVNVMMIRWFVFWMYAFISSVTNSWKIRLVIIVGAGKIYSKIDWSSIQTNAMAMSSINHYFHVAHKMEMYISFIHMKIIFVDETKTK